MSLFVLVISFLLGLSVVTCFLIAFLNRRKIPSMTAMMSAMVVGMGVGLTMGVLLGVYYQGDLFLSTLLSIGIGMTAGMVTGIPKGTLAILDGMLAGLMGGMMGAMLGEMISLSDGVLLVKIFLLLTICTTFIILILLFNVSEREKYVTRRWLLKPLITFGLLLLLFVGIEFIEVHDPSNNGDNPHEYHHRS